MAKKQTFILGIGAQKAGTTWLWSYLNSIDAVTLSRPKELHIFDAMLRPEIWTASKLRAQLDHANRGLKQRLKDRFRKRPKGGARPSDRIAMIEDPQAYIDFFKSMDPDASVVGEITPSYSMLRPDHFQFIADQLNPHFDVRVVFLMRDPVSRAFSGVKQISSVHAKTSPYAFPADPNEHLEVIMQCAHILERQDYEKVLKSLDAAFAPEQIYVDFFERLFQAETAKRITDFLGVPFKEPDFDRRVNAAEPTAPLDADLASRARAAYAPTYDYCRERFGDELIDDLWKYAGLPVT